MSQCPHCLCNPCECRQYEKPGKKPIKMEVIDNGNDQHFVMTFERPGRVEVSVGKQGNLIAYAYDGATIDKEQEPLFAFDGTLDHNNDCKA